MTKNLGGLSASIKKPAPSVPQKGIKPPVQRRPIIDRKEKEKIKDRRVDALKDSSMSKKSTKEQMKKLENAARKMSRVMQPSKSAPKPKAKARPMRNMAAAMRGRGRSR